MTEQHKTRIVIGLSGGVDSSAAAALLLQQGYAVIGVTLKLWPQDCLSRIEDKCCGPQAILDARSVAARLGIPFYVIDESEDFQKYVIRYFAEEYKAGRTPNPCILCNEKLKFGTLLERAQQLGAELIATGHYARIEKNGPGGRHLLKRARDLKKDQSYFLFSLRQDQLARAVFPLGEMKKPETREVARQSQLKTAQKEESVELCFVPDNDYGKYLQEAGWADEHRGEIVDLSGRVLGYHRGIEFYTIGQRKGLRLAAGKPIYVLELDPVHNRVIVGDNAALAREELRLERCNWIPFEAPPGKMEVLAKIRYNHPGARAEMEILPNGDVRLKFHDPQRAVTPGQACVLYQEDLVLGGGWIAR